MASMISLQHTQTRSIIIMSHQDSSCLTWIHTSGDYNLAIEGLLGYIINMQVVECRTQTSLLQKKAQRVCCII